MPHLEELVEANILPLLRAPLGAAGVGAGQQPQDPMAADEALPWDEWPLYRSRLRELNGWGCTVM